MLLKQAVCKNFRLLHDATFNFDANTTDTGSYGFTVIRGENTFGKTTTLNALRWAFFGSEVLATDYKLVDTAVAAKSSSTLVSVEILFAIQESFTNKKTKRTEFGWVDYKLKRSVTEKSNPDSFIAERNKETFLLQKKTGGRWATVEQVEAWLANQLPSKVDELFFVDGDDALSFVAGSRGDRRQLVKKAATDLLETSLLQDTIERVLKSKRKVLQAGRKAEASVAEYAEVEDEKSRISEALNQHKESLDDAESELKLWTDRFRESEAKWATEIAKGDSEDLRKQLETLKIAKDESFETKGELEKDLSTLLVGDLLMRSLVYKSLELGAAELEDQQVEGRMSVAVISALKTLLADGDKCFCGTSIADGTKCRKHIEKEVSKQAEFESEEGNIDRLRDSANRWTEKDPRKAQKETIESKLGRHAKTLERLHKFDLDEAELQVRLEKLAASDIDSCRRDKEDASKKRDAALTRVNDLKIKIRDTDQKLKELHTKSQNLQSELNKESEFKAKVTVHEELIDLIDDALTSIKTKQVEKLSKRLDKNFKQMTGEQDQADAVVESAELTEEFDIVVKSANGDLNTANQLSGAQKRALTYSFIHALVNESGVNAPSVIDTPLGMTSGPMKREITRQLIKNARQLILFLTRDEIKNIEDLIIEQGGNQITITRIGSGAVKNNKKGASPTIHVCECGIETNCEICELVSDFEQKIEGESGK